MAFKPHYKPFELEIIRTWYPTEGPEGCIARGLKNRTVGAIKVQAISMGINLTPEAAKLRRLAGVRKRHASAKFNLKANTSDRKWIPPEPRFASIFHAAQGVRV